LAHHIFDVRESATHGLVAVQLRDLADQFASGSVDLSYEEWHGPIEVIDPVNVVVDLKKSGHQLDLVIHLSWPTAGTPVRTSAAARR
jgi:amphi-Trp domain-containing protein